MKMKNGTRKEKSAVRNNRKILAIGILVILLIPLYENVVAFTSQNILNQNSVEGVNLGDASDFSIQNHNLSRATLDLSKLFPVVTKNITRAEFSTVVNFSLRNTIDIPLHNFSLTYYRTKDLIEEYPLAITIYPDPAGFIMEVEATSTQIIYYFKMDSDLEIAVNESVIFSIVFQANRLKSDLAGDGVEWTCSEIFDAGVIYSMDDPTLLVLEPTSKSAHVDFDGDGLANRAEKEAGLDPFRPDFWIKWVQRTDSFFLPPASRTNLPLNYYTQGYLGVPPALRDAPIQFTINALGAFTYLENLTVNSNIYYENLVKINYPYEIPQTSEDSYVKNITFLAENGDPSVPLEYNLSISVDGHLPYDITREDRDWDGDLLTDLYEIQHNLSAENPDSDGDGLLDGYDLSPRWNDIVLPGELRNYQIPLVSASSFLEVKIQLLPTELDYSLERFPFGKDFLTIIPALRIFNSPLGDALPDSGFNLSEGVSYSPLAKFSDPDTGSLLSYIGLFFYNAPSEAGIDNLLNITFQVVWLAFNESSNGKTLLHIFETLHPVLIQGFSVVETHRIDLMISTIGRGDDADLLNSLSSLIAVFGGMQLVSPSPYYSLNNFPNISYLNDTFINPNELNSTQEALILNLRAAKGISNETEVYFIRESLNTQSFHTLEWDPAYTETLTKSFGWVGVGLSFIADSIKVYKVYDVIFNVFNFGRFADKTLLQMSFWTYRHFFRSAYEHFTLIGGTLATVERFFGVVGAFINIALGVYNIVLGINEGGFNTIRGTMLIVSGALYIAAGVVALAFGSTFVGLVVAEFLWLAGLLIELFTPEPEVVPESLEPSESSQFDSASTTNHLTPSEGTQLTMWSKIRLGGNQDVKFRARMRFHIINYGYHLVPTPGGGYWEYRWTDFYTPWGAYTETATVSPGDEVEFSYTGAIPTWGRVIKIEVENGIQVQDVWYDNVSALPTDFTVYPENISIFLERVFDGSWFAAKAARIDVALSTTTPIVEIGEYVDFKVSLGSHYLGTPQRFKFVLFKSYGEVISLWKEEIYQYMEINPQGYWVGWGSGIRRVPLATAFPIITAALKNYEFGFTIKIPSECGPGLLGTHHIIIYAQSLDDPTIIQFRQVDFTVTSTRDYAVGVSPNTAWEVPGENPSWLLEIHNIGAILDTYTLSLDQLGPLDLSWISLSQEQVSLGPCQTAYITLTGSLPRNWNISPTECLRLTITSQEFPEKSYTHFPLLKILPYHDVRLIDIQPLLIIRPGIPSSFNVTLQNLGNVPETVHWMSILPGFATSSFTIPTSIQIQPGEISQFSFQLNAKKDPLLFPGNYTLSLSLRNEEDILILTTNITVTILDFHDVQLAGTPEDLGSFAIPRDIYEDKSYNFSIQIQNMGNVPDQFTLYSYPITTQNLVTVLTNSISLEPNEAIDINITVVPKVRGVETFYIVAHFTDENGILQRKNISSTLNVTDEDTSPPTIYFINAVPPVVMDAELASNVYYRSFWWTVYDRSGIYEIDALYDGVPVEYQAILEPTLMICNRTPDATEVFNMASPESPALLSIKHSLGESLGKYYTPEGSPPSFLNYFTVDLTASGGQIYGITIRRNGEEIAPLAWDLIQRSHSIFAIAIPNELGVFQFDITVKTYYWLNIYHSYVKTFHLQLFANVALVNTSYYIEIPLQLDDPTSAENESLHYFTVNAVDADYDLGLSEDRSGQIINRTICIFDDDMTPPEIQITASAFNPNVLLQGVLDLNMTESWRTITDQLAQFGFSRWVSWNLEDASGFSQTQVTYEIEGFDGTIILPERVIFNETETGSPYLKNLVGAFICSLIPGYHHFRVACSDGDADWEGDTLSNYKEYVFSITDDDKSPLELHNLTINSELVIDAVPMIEMTARVIDPTFARNPDLFQFLVFVDDQWVPDVSVSFEWSYDDNTSPPTFQEALVKLRFENTWAERDLSGNHTVEILTVDDDYDVLSMDPNPFAQYFEQNYETYRILHMAENLSFYSLFQGFYGEPLPYSFAGYFFNQSIYHLDFLPWFHPLIILTPYLINLFGFPVLDYTILDTNGEIYGRGQGFSPIYSAILPSFYAAAQLFFILLHNGVLESYNIPWARFNTSSVVLSRGTMEILSQHYGPVEPVDPLSFTAPADSFRVLESFDGLLLNYSYAQMAGPWSQAGTYNVSYTHIEGSNFSVYAMSDAFQSDLMFEDAQSRVITRSNLFSPNTHTPIWILPNASLGDIVPIVVNGEGDHLFNISGFQQYSISNTEKVNAWVLEDLTTPGGIAYYEVATGILLEGTFYFGEGYHYTLKLLDSNLEYTPSPILSTYPPTLSGTLSPEIGNQLQKYRFSTVYTDLDNNALPTSRCL